MSDTLPFGITNARTTDPDTSHEAADAGTAARAAALCAQILTVLEQHPLQGRTGYEVAQALGIGTHDAIKRLSDLGRQGLAHAPGPKRMSPESHKRQRVWVPGPDPSPKPARDRLGELETELAELRSQFEDFKRMVAQWR